MAKPNSKIESALNELGLIAEAELGTPCTNGLPPCIKLSDKKYRVGPYNIKAVNDLWVADHSNFELDFTSLQSAMMYCVCIYVGDMSKAKEIRLLDENIQRLTNEQNVFKHRISCALKAKDGWKIDLFTAKFSNNDAHLREVTKDLRMTLHSLMRVKFKKITLMIK